MAEFHVRATIVIEGDATSTWLPAEAPQWAADQFVLAATDALEGAKISVQRVDITDIARIDKEATG